MHVARTVSELHALTSKKKHIGFVPTMGALHDGHLSLIHIAQQKSDMVVASIFVNKTQFAAHEDLATYPRQEQTDLELLEANGTDIVYLPSDELMYPDGFSTSIDIGPIGSWLEGQPRPHFFGGVCLIVTKLLMQVMPTIAVFGEKDYQQLLIIQKLVRELNIPTSIIGGPILRDADGLAMSSRNQYLNKKQRAIAPSLFACLTNLSNTIDLSNYHQQLTQHQAKLIEAGFDSVDYLELRDADTLEPINDTTEHYRLLGAARLDNTRLIDNLMCLGN